MTTNILKLPNKLWLAAIKPPMYSVAIMPIILGTAIAFFHTHIFQAKIFFTFLTAAIFILAWENLANDVFDSETGIDQNKHHSLVNLTQNKNLIFWLGNLFLIMGIVEIFLISWWQQDVTVLALIIIACFLGYTYQGPPFRLGYQGLGEILCFVAFGPIAISAVYYSQTQTFSLTTLPLAVIIGITTSLILFCSHFHQVEDDIAAGKRSPVVRLGTAKSATILMWSTISIFPLTVIFTVLGHLPLTSLIIFASLPWAIQLTNFVQKYHQQPEIICNCKFLAINFHFISGILLSLSFILPNLILNTPLNL
jgi:1,4-dihydroxy-2-naphthoate octaprenyltransferase